MESTILTTLEDSNGGLALKKAAKALHAGRSGSEEEHKKAKINFKIHYDALLKSGQISEDISGNVTILSPDGGEASKEENQSSDRKEGA